MNKTVPATDAPALGFSLHVQLDKAQTRQLVFQSFVPIDADQKDINATMDKVVSTAERQIKKLRLEDLKRDARDLERQLKFSAEDMVRIDEQNRAEFEQKNPGRGFKLTAPQKSQREAAVTNAKRGKEMLEETLKLIHDLEIELN